MTPDDAELFAAERPRLLALAYRMLGDAARAEDMVQDAWLRWHGRSVTVNDPGAYLVRTVARLCLNELGSARARKEEARGDRLPEPVPLEDDVISGIEAMEDVSIAFLVLLQRLTPAERAVLLLHDVFDLQHDEIAPMVGKSVAACRQLLRRAKEQVAAEKRCLKVSEQAHRRLLEGFLEAAASGDPERVSHLLAEDVVLIADAGPDGGAYGRVRNLPGPLQGVKRVAAFLAAVTSQGAAGLVPVQRELNGAPAIVVLREGRPYAAILLSVVDDKIRGVFIQADPERLRRIRSRTVH